MNRDPSGPVYVVQFPHPGREHNPGKQDLMPWNTKSHARKFLRSPGDYVAPDGSVGEADLVFWGEWEAPSRVVARWPRDGRLPRFLHEPLWAVPHAPGIQNTDPWVFGDRFLYSNCKQLTAHGNPSALQSLIPGSVVLFGSQLDDEFVLDTVFVVADHGTAYTPVEATALEVEDAFRSCTLLPLATGTHERFDLSRARFTLLRGAMHDAPVAGMFSFVPARLFDGADPRFARPAIHLPERYLNPRSRQSPSGGRTRRSLKEARWVWESVRRQVFDAGCLLGWQFSTPPGPGQSL